MDAPPDEELPPEGAELEEEDDALFEDEPDGGGDLSYAAMFASSALSKLGLGEGGALGLGDPARARDTAAADPQVAAPNASRRRADDRGLAQGRQVRCGTGID